MINRVCKRSLWNTSEPKTLIIIFGCPLNIKNAQNKKLHLSNLILDLGCPHFSVMIVPYSISGSPISDQWQQMHFNEELMHIEYVHLQSHLHHSVTAKSSYNPLLMCQSFSLTETWATPEPGLLNNFRYFLDTHTHTHTCLFCYPCGDFHRHNGFCTVQTVYSIALHQPYT